MQPYGRVVGLDVSPRQLARARDKIAASPVAGVSMALRRASMGALPFEDDAFDGVAISQVLHALPEDVLPQTFAEIARVLRPGGFLALVEWSRPRLGYAALVWLPTLLGLRHSRNWRGTFPELVAPAGLNLVTERYLDSLNRYQLFTKPYPQDAHRPQ
jgi:ubiquinone/menaquinone biosynthesis C-methylase UbiE